MLQVSNIPSDCPLISGHHRFASPHCMRISTRKALSPHLRPHVIQWHLDWHFAFIAVQDFLHLTSATYSPGNHLDLIINLNCKLLFFPENSFGCALTILDYWYYNFSLFFIIFPLFSPSYPGKGPWSITEKSKNNSLIYTFNSCAFLSCLLYDISKIQIK